MRKIAIALLMCIAAGAALCQTISDTLYSRSSQLYYSEWYDTTTMFYNPNFTCCLQSLNYPYFTSRFYAISDYTSRPLQVSGLSAMVAPLHCHIDCYSEDASSSLRMRDTNKLAEYLYLYQQIGDSLALLESIRWDTATPQLLVLPRNHDTATFGLDTCYLYTALFDKPITVDSIFWIGGSAYSNEPDEIYESVSQHFPRFYTSFGNQGIGSVRPHYHNLTRYGSSADNLWYLCGLPNMYFGPFFAVAPDTSVLLEARSGDAAMGTVTGGGYYLDSSYRVIEAHPRSGYKFTHWNDGDRTNPRTVLLMHDTLFTAYFAPLEMFNANGLPNDPERGRVTGGGLYYEHDTVTFEALPWLEYAFVRWDDGDTANPRRFAITQDTTMTAIFVSRSGIGTPQEGAPSFTLTPNPATGTVRCTIEEGAAGKGWLTLHDAAGKVVLRRKVVLPGTHDIDISALPAGVYFATLTTAQGSSTLRLMVE